MEHSAPHVSANIVLIGMMGAGKTTLGRRLAKRLGMPFLDTDHEIEARAGVSIPHIFEVEGEAGFRDRESKVVAEVMSRQGQVVTTGGGAPLRPDNQQALRHGHIIYLSAEPRQLWARIRKDTSRPLIAQSSNPRKTIEQLVQARDPIYRSLAHHVVQSGSAAPAVLIEQMVHHLVQEGLVPQACLAPPTTRATPSSPTTHNPQTAAHASTSAT